MKTDITITTPPPARTVNTTRIASIYDVDITKPQTLEWHHNLPFEDKPWQIGLIVGTSGSGKTTLAKRLRPDGHIVEHYEWDTDKAIVDAIAPDHPFSEISDILTHVGLGDTPAWLRPYNVLSNGEKFRADMARAILTEDSPIIIDEFTSVVDRTVAKIVSSTVAKTIRKTDKKMIAVTCHYDVEDWLQPDWIYDVNQSRFTWRSVQPRPRLDIDIIECKPTAYWPMFSPYHYLSHTLPACSYAWLAVLNGKPVGFQSVRKFPHPKVKNLYMGARLVVLPDYQGIGIATVLKNFTGEFLANKHCRYRTTVGNPAMIHLQEASPRWKHIRKNKSIGSGRTSSSSLRKAQGKTRRLRLETFEYIPQGDTQYENIGTR